MTPLVFGRADQSADSLNDTGHAGHHERVLEAALEAVLVVLLEPGLLQRQAGQAGADHRNGASACRPGSRRLRRRRLRRPPAGGVSPASGERSAVEDGLALGLTVGGGFCASTCLPLISSRSAISARNLITWEQGHRIARHDGGERGQATGDA